MAVVYGRYNYSIHGVYKPTYNWGAPSCTSIELGDFSFIPGPETHPTRLIVTTPTSPQDVSDFFFGSSC